MLKIEEVRKKHREELSSIEVSKKVQELAEKGLIRLASGSKMEVAMPPKFPGKPLSEYLKEIRE